MYHLSKKYLFLAAILFAIPVFAQKNKLKNDSISIRDSIREKMFQGALLSMDALQSKFESQKEVDLDRKQQKAAESQNLFFQSRAYYRKALTFDQNYYPAWTNMGTTYFLQDIPKASIPCFRRAILLNENYSPAWYNLGRAYAALQMKDSALYSYKQAIRTDSTSLMAYQELSRIIMANDKDSATALTLLRLAFKYKPDSEVPKVAMASIYFSMNDSVNGMQALATAAWIYPGDIKRLQQLYDYYNYHKDPKKAEFYLSVLAIEKMKQEVPVDGNPDK